HRGGGRRRDARRATPGACSGLREPQARRVPHPPGDAGLPPRARRGPAVLARAARRPRRAAADPERQDPQVRPARPLRGGVSMSAAYLVAGVRTPIGRYAGALAPVRTDDLAAHVISTLMSRHGSVDWGAVD